MNSKNLIHILSVSAFALGFAACSNSDNSSSNSSSLSAAANAAKQALLGTWLSACTDFGDQTSNQQRRVFSSTQVSISLDNFDNSDCSGAPESTSSATADYMVGDASPTSNNVGGFPVDLTLSNGDVLLSIFRIEQNDTVLLLGDPDDSKDAEGRDATLDTSTPFMKSNTAAPTATPAPSAAPADNGRAAAQESLQGPWFRACQAGESDGTAMRDRFTFDGTQVSFNRDVYDDSGDCSTSPDAEQSFSQAGTITVGDSLTTSGGMTARAIDFDFGAELLLLSIFLVDENGTRLLIGDEDGPKDSNGRESQLSYDLPYTAGLSPVAVTSSCDSDADGGFACANQLGTIGFDNQRIEDSISVPFGDSADYFAFEIAEADELFGTTLIMDARDPTGEGLFQPVCRLYENDEGTPREIDQSCQIRRSRTRNGNYFFVVQGADQQSDGAYQIDYFRE